MSKTAVASPSDHPERRPLEQLARVLRDLRLHTAMARLEELLATPPNVGRVDWLLAWLEGEANRRRESRVERRFKRSKLPERKTLIDFDFNFQPSLSRDQIMDLATLAFVKTGHNVLFAGKSGTGKSHLAMALGFCACLADLDVRYTTCAAMLGTLNASLADGSLSKVLKKYTLPSLLIVDEVGLEQVERATATRAGLMQKVLLPRYERRRSTIVTSNIDWDMWGDYFNDHLGATAIIDRLLHHSHVIVFGGRSKRYFDHEREVEADRAKRQAAAGPGEPTDDDGAKPGADAADAKNGDDAMPAPKNGPVRRKSSRGDKTSKSRRKPSP